MSFFKRRKARQLADRMYEKAAGVKRNDTTAQRYTGGNTYSRADIEQLEREHTRYWKRRR
jgi:hypothetical protein